MYTTSNISVSSPNLKYTEDYIFSEYEYEETLVTKSEHELVAKPYHVSLSIRTGRKVGKVGVMLVGWGGNNGSTFTAAVLANRHQLSWNTKNGQMDSNWYGSITQASTVRLGLDEKGNDVFVAMSQLLPMVHPDDLVIDGWDISPMNLADAMVRAKVIDYDLQQKLRKEMLVMKPRPAIYDPDFIAANQADRAVNLIRGTRYEQYLQIRADIKDFRDRHKLDKVVVLWTANTERFCEIIPGVHDTGDNLEKALRQNNSEISPSTIFALAAIDEGCCYINGSPQNTIVQGVVERAEKNGVFVAGDDFKSGQTKLKSVLVDFLVSAGLKPVSIVSYNHLGNNDGKNLSAPKQFRSKEISKSNVVDDMVESNPLIYKPGEKPDHVVVIKYVPYVGDSKRAMDEYTSEILLHGTNTIAVHNTCEDSLLAVPLILDLVLLADLFSRVAFRRDQSQEWSGMHAVLSPLAYLLKAPLVPPRAPVVNALFKQRACVENIMRACLALPPAHHMQLEHKVHLLKAPLVPPRAPVVNALFKQRACVENIMRACLALPPAHHMQLEHKVHLLKAPLVPPRAPVVNALFKQRACVENIMRACLALPPAHHMQLEHKVHLLKAPLVPPRAPVVNALFKQRACVENIMRACLALPPAHHMQLEHKVHLLKAPLVPPRAPVVNALFKQRACVENIMRACLALPPAHHMQLEHKVPFLMSDLHSGAMFKSSPPTKKQKLAHTNGDQQ